MTAAGIVLFNPEIQVLKANIDAIKMQVDYVFLIDNNSFNITSVETQIEQMPNVLLIKNKTNLGIAAALNQIIYVCELKGVKWVLTLDQDSISSDQLIKNYLKYTGIKEVGVMTPNIIDRNYNKEKSNVITPKVEYVDKCITSGSFISIDLFQYTGYFDEKMFIDLVDFEFCIRVKKVGYKILRVNSVTLLHKLGELKVYNFLNKGIRVTNHSKQRVYYMARNTIYMSKKHKDYLKKKQVFIYLFKKIFKIVVFEKNKTGKVIQFFHGVMDGYKMIN